MSPPAEYWLADSEARVLGPVSLEVVTDLHARGKLADVRAVSTDGKRFKPLREMPELQAVLAARPAVDAAQLHATRQIREWLSSIERRPTHEVLHVPVNASRDACRAAFFALVHRYVPSRLPADTTPELRLACEDAFLVLSERMVELERSFRGAPVSHAPPLPPPPPPPDSPPAQVFVRPGLVQVRLSLKRGDARPFTQDQEAHWRTDGLFVASMERVVPNTPCEVTLGFEGHVTQLHAVGRVHANRQGGFAVVLPALSEDQRAMIRTWVARATAR